MSFVKLNLIAFLSVRDFTRNLKTEINKETKKFLDLHQFQGTGLSIQPETRLDFTQLVPCKT